MILSHKSIIEKQRIFILRCTIPFLAILKLFEFGKNANFYVI